MDGTHSKAGRWVQYTVWPTSFDLTPGRGRVLGRRSLCKQWAAQKRQVAERKGARAKWQNASGSNYFSVRGANEWNRAECVLPGNAMHRGPPCRVWLRENLGQQVKGREVCRPQCECSASQPLRLPPTTNKWIWAAACTSFDWAWCSPFASPWSPPNPSSTVSIVDNVLFFEVPAMPVQFTRSSIGRPSSLGFFQLSHNCFSNSSRFRKTVNSLLICAHLVIFLSLRESGRCILEPYIFWEYTVTPAVEIKSEFLC